MFHGKTTIRTGLGIYFDGNQNDVQDFAALSYPPLLSAGLSVIRPASDKATSHS